MSEMNNIDLLSQQYLFAKPGFFSGFSSIFDLSGSFNLYNSSPNGEIADALAFKSDQRALGQDLKLVALTYKPRV